MKGYVGRPIETTDGETVTPSRIAPSRLAFFASVTAGVLAAVSVIVPLRVRAADTVTLKLASVVPKNSVWLNDLEDMADDWKKISGGTVQVKLYGGGMQGDDADVVRKMKLGTLDGGLLSVTGMHTIDHAVSAFTVPMMLSDYDEFYGVLGMLEPDIDKVYESQGYVVLNWADAGWVHFLTKEPVKTPDDLRKLKIFTWQDDASGAADLWKAAGFNAVPLPSTEITTALQTGLISALPTSAEPASLLQWNQHAKYMTDINWGMLLGATVVTKKSWDKIPPDMQVKLRESAAKTGLKLREGTRTAEAGAIDAMKDHGLTVEQPDLDAWRKVVEPMWPKIRGSIVPADWFDKVKAARDEYRAKHEMKPLKKADAK